MLTTRLCDQFHGLHLHFAGSGLPTPFGLTKVRNSQDIYILYKYIFIEPKVQPTYPEKHNIYNDYKVTRTQHGRTKTACI